jgi:GH15 family glucan-1,4-alpha-glucosidase
MWVVPAVFREDKGSPRYLTSWPFPVLLWSRVYTIHGGKELDEVELEHLAGHKGSKPVRIGNGAVDHLQLVSTNNTKFETDSIGSGADTWKWGVPATCRISTAS